MLKQVTDSVNAHRRSSKSLGSFKEKVPWRRAGSQCQGETRGGSKNWRGSCRRSQDRCREGTEVEAQRKRGRQWRSLLPLGSFSKGSRCETLWTSSSSRSSTSTSKVEAAARRLRAYAEGVGGARSRCGVGTWGEFRLRFRTCSGKEECFEGVRLPSSTWSKTKIARRRTRGPSEGSDSTMTSKAASS